MIEYTFTFAPIAERKFQQVLDRLDPEEYNILEGIRPVDNPNNIDDRYLDRQTIIEMDEECALTFRFSMGDFIKIRRKRTEKELAEEKKLLDANKVTIKVIIPSVDSNETP